MPLCQGLVTQLELMMTALFIAAASRMRAAGFNGILTLPWVLHRICKPQCSQLFCTIRLMTTQVCYPKRTSKPLYQGLVTQLESLGLPFLEADDILHGEQLAQRFDVVLDAMFGFSFQGDPRPPFDTLLQACDQTWALGGSCTMTNVS